MPIEPKRIEAAARAIARANGLTHETAWRRFIFDARPALEAAYPELASDPPTAWVAPWEASEAMVAACKGLEPYYEEDPAMSADDAFAAMRDAYTKEQT